jgi:hypothetical protein
VKDNRESFYRKIGEKNAKNIENVVGSLGLSHNRYQIISGLDFINVCDILVSR